MSRIEETLPPALDGERIDRVVAMLAACSRAEAADLVGDGAVRLDGRVVTGRSARVRRDQVVVIEVPEAAPGPLVHPEPEVALTVVHEDDDVVVVDKPAGLVVHPGAGNHHGTMVNGLVARYPEIAEVGEPQRPGVVHRIDKGTSGLLVVARTPGAHESLVDQLSRRTVEREYLALVWGRPEATQGAVDAPIGRSGRDPTRMAVSNTGREARTHYVVERTFDDPTDVSLLRCRLETGRTHQIRVHMAAIGHPVVGDGRYGGDRPPIEVARPWLHAASLGFDHPRTGQAMRFESPLPPELAEVLDRLS